MSNTPSNAFQVDMSFQVSGEVPVAVCASAPDVLWLWLSDKSEGPDSYLVKLSHDGEGWGIAQDDKGPVCHIYDLPGPFPRVDPVPDFVVNGLDEVLAAVAENADLLYHNGLDRVQRRYERQLAELKSLVAKGYARLEEKEIALDREVRMIDPRKRLGNLEAAVAPHRVRRLVHSDIGLMILDIQDEKSFTLSTPGVLMGSSNALLMNPCWKDGAWENLPWETDHANAVRQAGENVLRHHAEDFKLIALSKIAVAKHELEMEREALGYAELRQTKELEEKYRAALAVPPHVSAPTP